VRVARVRIVRLLAAILVGLAIGGGAYLGSGLLRDRAETNRTTARFDPPVWAGQQVPGACSGGFYARHDRTVVITIVGHCGGTSGTALRDGSGRLVGVFGPPAQLSDCPAGRFCAPSDFMTLAIARDRIPWGHLNMVDLGVGGYRTIVAPSRPLACADIQVGDRVEIDGREHYRQGSVIATGPYAYPTDIIFPCMLQADIAVADGDSGGAVLVNGAPAGITSRDLGGHLGFTPLAEGLQNLGLSLCLTPDCDLSPATAVQPDREQAAP
jgi:hypothetical protein